MWKYLVLYKNISMHLNDELQNVSHKLYCSWSWVNNSLSFYTVRWINVIHALVCCCDIQCPSHFKVISNREHSRWNCTDNYEIRAGISTCCGCKIIYPNIKRTNGVINFHCDLVSDYSCWTFPLRLQWGSTEWGYLIRNSWLTVCIQKSQHIGLPGRILV